MELILNLTPVVNFGEVRWAQLAKSNHLTATVVPLRSFLNLLRSVQIRMRESSAESNGKLLHLIIRGETAALVPALAWKDLPLGRML